MVRKVSAFSSPEVAAEKGYKILFREATPDEADSSKWEVPLNHDPPRTIRKSSVNEEMYKGLANKFPSYSVQFEWLREVRRPVGDATEFDLESNTEGKLYYRCKRSVQLHGVAMELLMGMVATRSHSDVLYASRYALRAVHIIATGLLGLLKKCTREVQTEAQRNACLSVEFSPLRLSNDSGSGALNMSTFGSGYTD